MEFECMSIRKVSIRQIKAARVLLGWSQDDLAKHSEVSLPTVKRLEAAEGDIGGRAETGESLVAALQEAGVEFIEENGGGAGVRLAKRQRRSR
jgi:predicted transcriptional regulator